MRKEESDKKSSRAKYTRRRGPRSLVSPKSATQSAPRTSHSFPTGRAPDSKTDRQAARTSLSPPPDLVALRRSMLDEQAAAILGAPVPFDAEVFSNTVEVSDSYDNDVRPLPISPLPSYVREDERNGEIRGMPGVDSAFLPPGEHERSLVSASLPDNELDLKYMSIGPNTEPGLESLHFGRLLRRVRKRTDEILLKRTEWRHEYGQLEHCRRFLDDSITRLMAAVKTHFPGVATDLNDELSFDASEGFEKLAEGNSLSEEMSPSDEISPLESDTFTSQRSSKSRERRRDRSPTSGAETHTSDSNNIASLHQRCKADYKAVQRQAAKTTRLGDQLSNLEYHQAIDMKTVQEMMYAKDFVSELKSEAMQAPLAPSEANSKSSESSLPPLLAQYFDRKGDVGIYQERLQECDFNHGEGVTERAFLRDRGEKVVPSDEAFDYNYRTRRREIEEDLRTAQEEVDILRQRCLDNGDNPDEWRASRRSMNPVSTQPSGYTAPNDIDIGPTIHQIPLGALELPLQAERQSTRRIDRWLQTVQRELSDQPPGIKPSETVAEEVQEPTAMFSLAFYESRNFDIDAFRSDFKSLKVPG